jgi:betaine-aldehyde dehydrogenase
VSHWIYSSQYSCCYFADTQIPSEDTVNDAVNSAHNAFQGWSSFTSKRRGEMLYKAATLMEQPHTIDELCMLECIDAGIPISQVMDGHVRPAIDCLKYFAALAMSSSSGMPGTGRLVDTPDAGGHHHSFTYTRRESLGVCAGIGPWNYPLAILMWKLAPALACGNTFVFKPSESTPMTALKLAGIMAEAGLPPGVFNVLPGDRNTGALLTQHKLVSKISFTGSTNTGILISKDAATTLKKVTMELGGKSPLVVFDDCDVDNAVGAAIMANFINNGEACSNGTR